jgi:hypothetical protein
LPVGGIRGKRREGYNTKYCLIEAKTELVKPVYIGK